MKIKAFTDEYLVNRSQDTSDAYTSDLLKYKRFLAVEENGITPEEVKPTHISRYVRWLEKHPNRRTKKKGLSESTVQRHMASVRAYYSWLQYSNPDMLDPTRFYHVRRERDKQQRKVPAIETEVIEAMCRESPQKLDVAIVKLLHRGGVRLSELISLNRDSLKIVPECDDAPLHAKLKVIGKGKKKRTVLIAEDAVEAIGDYLDDRKDKNPALFISSRGLRISKRTVQRIIARLALLAGEGHAHPHQLRHSYGGDMINNGMDANVLRILLGHDDLKTTMLYSEVEEHNAARQYHAAMEMINPKKLKANRARAKAKK